MVFTYPPCLPLESVKPGADAAMLQRRGERIDSPP
jgi:hypothetical protein